MRTSISSTLTFLTIALACTTAIEVAHTFYEYPNNDTISAVIAYDCGRGFEAGGSGTYDGSLTFASAPEEYNQCENINDPYTRKYPLSRDFYPQCKSEWIS